MIPGLTSPHPFIHLLPGAYQEDDFTARFVAAFDDALAPILSTVDNIPAYVDPGTAPADLLAFVGSWVAANLDPTTPLGVQRLAVREAVETHRFSGTARGLRSMLHHLTGGDVEIADSGATAWSVTPGAEAPGTLPARLQVRIGVDDPEAVDLPLINAAVAAAVPPYVQHEIEVWQR
ncbi:phage tail protein [Kribbia dieselivorans]|uniref:phage tail protein n=1 Tax=Kribbia dieselivorans TaxID=331526 RepID=UPI000838B7A0|nr:phage tail protein [Kribbia dieselivorans]